MEDSPITSIENRISHAEEDDQAVLRSLHGDIMQRQFYHDSEIYGTVDFICGDATAVFQNCLIEARTPMARQYNTITAQHRELESLATGIVLQNCTIKATRDLKKLNNVTTFLGRPWGIFSRTVIMESYIDNLIDPKGWVE
ncbi:hypothetical protein MTR67_001715 [Solanum verrucosum]|uniref:Pectinesterase catalytic domain-containing protein n=1 Tax=Solanum verrucosum TaxID=315347 RepID=A0AAF0PR30_SOLVR|nr:hypothetical protein MTR67_001715 [Solanum verrucosum]